LGTSTGKFSIEKKVSSEGGEWYLIPFSNLIKFRHGRIVSRNERRNLPFLYKRKKKLRRNEN
jgi:hypothetical protein